MSEIPNNNILNEQHYIELSNQLKEKYEIYEKENNNLKSEMFDMKKDIMTIYGLIRTIDNFYSNYIINEDPDDKMQFLIDTTRTLLSGIIEANILS